MINGTIYIIKNNINEKVYIGQTTQKPEDRFKQHLKLLKTNKKQLIHKAIKKYGKENFYFEILQTNIESIKKLNELEEFYIEKYNSISPNGYNLCKGGNQSRKPCKIFTQEEIDEMISLYVKDKKSLRYICEVFGITNKNKVSKILKENGCEIRNKTCNLPDKTSKITNEILIEMFVNQKMKPSEIAEILNVDVTTIRQRIRYFSLREYNT